MLDLPSYAAVVKGAPLVSIDLCVLCNGKILLGQRNNEPLKGIWFTPGGRIFKNEAYSDCLRRIAWSELGLKLKDSNQARFMGVWDHFYDNSAFSEAVSTHYVNLPHYVCFQQKPSVILDQQHTEMLWFNLSEVARDSHFHKYMRAYASWLIVNGVDND